jgi:hypothetical protein
MRTILVLITVTCYSPLIWSIKDQTNEEWGTLFFSKQARNKPIVLATETTMHYQGILKSINKRKTYWLNNKMQQSLPNGMYLKNNQLVIPRKEKQIILAPGEQYDG